MAKNNQTHLWISLWFLITAPVIVWDAFFIFSRPRSFAGNDLHWIWKPYAIYQNVDMVYGVQKWEDSDGFPAAQSALNIIETCINILYLYTAHILDSPGAPLLGFAGALMTLSKTTLYWGQEYYCNFCGVGHNDWQTLGFFYILPNVLWIVFPGLIVKRLGLDIVDSLRSAAAAASTSATSAKKNSKKSS